MGTDGNDCLQELPCIFSRYDVSLWHHSEGANVSRFVAKNFEPSRWTGRILVDIGGRRYDREKKGHP